MKRLLDRLRPARRDGKAGRRDRPRAKRRESAPADAGEGGRNAIDGATLVAALVLCCLGVVMSYSATAPLAMDAAIPPLFLRHLSALAIGAALAFVAASLPFRVWELLAYPMWGIAVLLLIATAIGGVEVNGAQRWLAIPGLDVRFQPVEFTKLGTLLAVVAAVSPPDAGERLTRPLAIKALILAAIPIGLLVLQPDLGDAVVLAILVALILIAAGAPLRQLLAPGTIAIVGFVLFVAFNDYARRRVVTFLDPWNDALGSGFQLVQSFVAFGNGGILGVGIGGGSQKLFYLPEAHTDFILSLIAEELGLVGVLVVLGAFAALLIYGTRIARYTPRRFPQLIAFGATALLTVPALVNGAVVMGLAPTKGLTLPFLSYGGNALIMNCLVLGILLGISRHTAKREPRAISGANLRRLAWR